MADLCLESAAKINVRDCQTMIYQNAHNCANCYQDISTGTSMKFNDEMRLEAESDGDVALTLVEALNLVFSLHKNSHLSSIILDESKYSLCRGCYILFSKLFQIFSEFSDLSSPPSYLFSIIGRHPLFHQIIPLVEIKTEDGEIYSPCMGMEGVESDEDIAALSEIETEDISDEKDCRNETETSVMATSKSKWDRNCKAGHVSASCSSDEDDERVPYGDGDWDSDFDSSDATKKQCREKKPSSRKGEEGSLTDDSLQTRKKRPRIRAKTHMCKECNIGFTRSNHLTRHMKLHSCKEFTCECGVGFKSDRNLKYHQKFNCRNNPSAIIFTQPELPDPVERAIKIARKKQAAKLIKNAKKKPREQKSFVCPHSPCGRVFSRSYRLKRHEKIHVNKPHLCEYCHNSYRDEDALSRHIKTTCRVFKEGGQFCKVEDEKPEDAARRLKVLDRLQRKRLANNTRRYVCHCGETFSRTNHLRTHSRVHKEKNFTCQECNAGFVTDVRLQKHARIHDPDYTPNESIVKIKSTFDDDGKLVRSTIKRKKSKKDSKELATCEVCGKSVSARNLKIHMVSHMGDRPMVCELCGNAFKTIWSLKCHQKYAHGTERPFLCRFCGRAFKRNQHMVDHEIVAHSDNRAYVCKEPNCDKSFKSARNLRQHRLLHKGVKFDCPKCGSTFSRKDNLKVHVEKHCGKSTPVRRRTAAEATTAVSYTNPCADHVTAQQNATHLLNPMFPAFETDVPIDSINDNTDATPVRQRKGRIGRTVPGFKPSRKSKLVVQDVPSFAYPEDHTNSSSGGKTILSSVPEQFHPLQLTSNALSNESEQTPRTTAQSFYGPGQMSSRAHLGHTSMSSSFSLNICGGQQLPLVRNHPFGFVHDVKNETTKDNSASDRAPNSSNPPCDAYDLRQYEGIPF